MLSQHPKKRARSASLPDLPAIDLTDTLRAIPIFSAVDDDVLAHKIAPNLHLRLYRHGDLLVKEGERGAHLFILLSGTATVWSERSECQLAEMTQGAVFGEIAVLYDQMRTASVRLSSATGKVAVLAREDLLEALKDDKELLQRLRERAKAHLHSDLQSLSEQAEAVIVSQELVKSAFDEFTDKEDDLLRLFLADCKGYRLQTKQRIPLINNHVYLLHCGQATLMGVGKTEAVSGGRIINGDQDDFDYLSTNTACTLLVTPVAAYKGLVKGKIYDSDSDSEPARCLIPVHGALGGGGGEPTRKRARTSVDEQLLRVDKSCTTLRLEGKWQFGREELLYICNNFTNLHELILSDWSPCLTKESLAELRRLESLHSLKLININSVDDAVIQALPPSIVNLDVSYCNGINDFGSFSHLDKMKSLTMVRCSPTTATRPLPTTLTHLTLAECNLMTDGTLAKAIESLHLASLDLSFCESVKDISMLSKLFMLKKLILKRTNSVNDVTLKRLLEALTSLEQLDVSFNPDIHDLLEIVRGHHTLKTVMFDHCPHIDHRQASTLLSLFST